ncbi:MAG: hypothetical protein GX589_05240 [Deltaproteobacteria bacterium]|nr:hypothetical protein [Deltaproteobacteria bacterium]
MQNTHLEIKLFTTSGEVVKSIICRSGRITVLRAFSPVELGTYQRILAGVPGPERYSITLGAEPCDPANHLRIGFGESCSARSMTVTAFFKESGVPLHNLDTTLLSYGLEHVQDKTFAELTPCQIRRIYLLAAVHTDHKVMILNNPFEPITNEWKERFAQLLVEYVRNTNAIVLIPSLDFRPECWIDNELIIRVQVGELRQKTIGFDSCPHPLQEIIKTVRREIKDGASQPDHNADAKPNLIAMPSQLVQAEPQTHSRKQSHLIFAKLLRKYGTAHTPKQTEKKKSRTKLPFNFKVPKWVMHESGRSLSHKALGLALAVIVLAIFAAQSLILNNNDDILQTTLNQPKTQQLEVEDPAPEPVQSLTTQDPPPAPLTQPISAEQQPNDNLLPAPPEAPETPAPELKPDPTPAPVPNFILDTYPVAIKKSILESFETEDPRSYPLRDKRPNAKPQDLKPSSTKQVHFELLNALQAASSKDDGPIRPPSHATLRNEAMFPENFATMDREERRNLMREKFRQAIERASMAAEQ